MGQKDKAEKLLEDYNDVFADIVNVLLFDGKSVVDPNSLEDSKLRSQYKADNSKLHEMERDIAKHWKEKEMTIALYGIENQSEPDKVMPVRILGYDGSSYRSQLLKNGENGLNPVVTIVLYFGQTRWNQPKNLKQVIHVPKELEPYVNDYKIHVFEISWLSDEQVGMFRSDFGIVAEYFTQMRKNKNYAPSERQIQHVDEVLKLLSVFGEDGKLAELAESNEKKGEKKMAGIIDRYIEERMAEREKQLTEQLAEREKQMAEQMAERENQMAEKEKLLEKQVAAEFLNTVQNLLQNSSGLTLEKAISMIGKTMEEYNKAKAVVER